MSMSGFSTVILAAGQGTRMKSALAKVLHPLVGEPMLAYSLDLAVSLGSKRTVLVLGHQSEAVEKAMAERFPGKFEVALQKEQRGTAHAVEQAMPLLSGENGSLLILYGDVPVLRQETVAALKAAYKEGGLALVTAKPASPHGYGRIVRSGQDPKARVERIVEEKDCTAEQRAIGEINAGIYMVDLALLRKALGQVSTTNAQREFYLTDLVEIAAKAGEVAAVIAEPDEVAGINDKSQLAACDRVLRLRSAERHMKAGVSLRDPATVVIERSVTVGQDSEIGAGVELRGKTKIGTGCRIEAGCMITNAEIADGVHIKPYCVIVDSKVGTGSILGPFAHLRPGSELDAEVHVGNFVETKKTKLGRGAKANHLSYLGDAEIGAKVNVGAGTITCNYDGVNKFKTVIEEGSFIGSDTQLVAPVTVGKGAYVGAGTTITVDVPPGALAISRTKQTNIDGYVARKKNK